MRLTEQVHSLLEQAIHPGNTVIDATAGNGHDALAMARMVGSTGVVFAIDLQAAAIESTRTRLEAAGHLAQCKLIEDDHADALNQLLDEHREDVAAITFNLGYLPGGEKDLTTLADTTLRALDAAKCLIRSDGILLMTAYRGHAGGKEEAEQVETWMRALSADDWQVESHEPATRHPDRVPPILWIARRIKKGLRSSRP